MLRETKASHGECLSNHVLMLSVSFMPLPSLGYECVFPSIALAFHAYLVVVCASSPSVGWCSGLRVLGKDVASSFPCLASDISPTYDDCLEFVNVW